MKLSDIAGRLNGEVQGDGTVEITGLSALDDATDGDLSFLANPRYAAAVSTTKASAVLVGADWEGESAAAIVRVANADRAFAQAAELLGPDPIRFEPGVHPSACIAESVQLGEGVHVGPHCVIAEHVSIGDRTVLMAGCYIGHRSAVGADAFFYPNVTVRENSLIGERVIVHAGSVIGSDGFGYIRVKGAWQKVPQIGRVVLGDDVEIGANVTIDRARFGDTVIAKGSKIDNLVQVAHNVRIGEHTAVAAQVGISGSTRIGSGVQLGGQAGLAGHLEVGDGAIVGAQAGVTKDVESGTFVSGYPAMPHATARKMHAHMMRIPVLKKQLSEMKERLAALEERLRKQEGV